MQTFIEQLINGITVGSFYALVALGYTMVYGVLTMINFAHGEIFMLGAYFGFFTITRLVNIGLYQSNPTAAIFITFLCGGLFSALAGITVEKIAYRPLRKATRLATLISAIGASIVLQELVRLLPTIGTIITSVKVGTNFIFPQSWQLSIMSVLRDLGGPAVKAYPGVLGTDGIRIAQIFISYSRMLIVIISLSIMLILNVLVRFTKIGKAMRAVSEDKDTAALMGINVNQIISYTFLIGSALAGIAGVMVGMFYLQIRPTMGFVPGIKAFTSAVLGGIGNIPGAMVGGYILGLAEVIGIQFLPAVYKDFVAFMILILTLIFKPTGILGGTGGQNKL